MNARALINLSTNFSELFRSPRFIGLQYPIPNRPDGIEKCSQLNVMVVIFQKPRLASESNRKDSFQLINFPLELLWSHHLVASDISGHWHWQFLVPKTSYKKISMSHCDLRHWQSSKIATMTLCVGDKSQLSNGAIVPRSCLYNVLFSGHFWPLNHRRVASFINPRREWIVAMNAATSLINLSAISASNKIFLIIIINIIVSYVQRQERASLNNHILGSLKAAAHK